MRTTSQRSRKSTLYEQTSDFLLPQPAAKSFGWEHLHFEHHHQPQFDTPEHEANWHVITAPRIAVSLDNELRSGNDGWMASANEKSEWGAIIPAAFPSDVGALQPSLRSWQLNLPYSSTLVKIG